MGDDSAVPHNIAARQRLAVVIPYRDREDHLEKMLPATQECLQRSNISGDIEEFRRLSNPDDGCNLTRHCSVHCAWLAPLFVASSVCFVYDAVVTSELITRHTIKMISVDTCKVHCC